MAENAPKPPLAEPRSASTLPAPGTRIGQSEIIRELGRGGMGAVYAARDTKLGRKVAIKLLSSNDHPELTARFLIRMVAGQHPLAPLRGWDLVVTGVIQEPMPNVRGVCPNLPDELADVIDRCLKKPKDQRFGTARELLDAVEPLLPGRYVRQLRSDESPYAGLKSFQESDAHRFFGRSRDVAAAVARLRDVPLLGIVGPSGVGKSSLVRAGIVPALKASGEPWSTIVVRPGRSPMAALAYAITPMVSTTSNTPTSTTTPAISSSSKRSSNASTPSPATSSSTMSPRLPRSWRSSPTARS